MLKTNGLSTLKNEISLLANKNVLVKEMKRERSVLLSIVLFSLYLSLIVCEIRVTPDGTRVNEEGDEVFHVKERSANAEATLCAQGTFLYYYTSSYVGECVPQYNSATA